VSIDWGEMITWSNAFNLLDILIVWYLVYKLIMIFKGTRAIQLLKGVGIFVLIKFAAVFLQLQTIDWIMNSVIQWGVVAVIIVFQPEIRKGLEHLGKTGFRKRSKRTINAGERLVAELDKAVQYMAKRKIGALISLEEQDSLDEYASTGIPIGGVVTNQLLINIFIPNTPLHDGAVIIQDYKIATAASYLPLSESSLIPKELGTRHRAAIGLSEVSDAITIIVSEETGGISIAHGNRLLREMTRENFVAYLTDQLVVEDQEEKSTNFIQDIFDNMKWGSSE
jgi:diadenylate cyclase